jgi:hypothetical protein
MEMSRICITLHIFCRGFGGPRDPAGTQGFGGHREHGCLRWLHRNGGPLGLQGAITSHKGPWRAMRGHMGLPVRGHAELWVVAVVRSGLQGAARGRKRLQGAVKGRRGPLGAIRVRKRLWSFARGHGWSRGAVRSLSFIGIEN